MVTILDFENFSLLLFIKSGRAFSEYCVEVRLKFHLTRFQLRSSDRGKSNYEVQLSSVTHCFTGLSTSKRKC